ncbi:MAG: extracellular solute-binding protein [Herpetosiphonaceae bacterium]|nr:extracellular solute-binding protein [Herpetosiphonaceae bacterium]
MPKDPERNPKSVVSRRDVLKRVGLGAVGLTLAACGAGTSNGGASAGATAATGGTTAANATTGGLAAETVTSAAVAGAATATTAAGGAATAAAPTPEPTVGVAQIGKGTQKLVFWHGLGGADGATMVKMLQTYAATKPDIALRSETYDWGVFYQKLPTATAAGTPPDMVIMHSWAMKQFVDQSILQPAEDIFYSGGLVPKNDFNPALISAVTFDNKTASVPFDNHGWLNWVNTKVITDAGLDPKNLPKNGTDFIPWAQKIVVDDKGKHPNESGFNPDKVKVWATHSSWQRYTPMSTIWQFGGGIFSDDAKKSLLDDPKSIAAMQYWQDLITKHHVVPPAVPGVAGPGDLMKSNSIALMWDGTWNLNFFKDNPEIKVLPSFLNSYAPDGKQVVRFDSHQFVIPAGVKDPGLAAAKDLIVYLSNNGETWATSGQVPARLSVQAKPAVTSIQSVTVAANQFKAIGRPGQTHKAINEIVTTYETAFSAILSNTTPAPQAMQDASKAVQAILDRG